MKPPGQPSLPRFCLLMLMLLSYTDAFVIGAPRGSHVVSGTASFTQDGNLTVITAGNRSIINYQSFDIGKNETVQFVQPNASATVLNRVTTADPTNIFGHLDSNGIVIIANPYGVFFRNGSVVNVGGLIAGAGQISDADFTAGKIHFTDLTGDVRNDGVIAADNRIALMGANVVNTGSLTAAHGMAMLVSGADVYVGERHGNIFVQANGRAIQAAAVAGSARAGSVNNSGTVAAPRVLLGAGDLYSTAIVNSGLLQGRSISVNAGRNGSATVGGTLDASSARHPTTTGQGGSIDVLGGTITLKGATLDASGATGGGNIRVGGDFHGGGTLPHANTTVVDAATTLNADATGAKGDGGSVVLWSDTGTYYGGNISARGGSAGGNGGAVEVSSHNELLFRGTADLTAANGKTGTLLLDPSNITISDTGADYTGLSTLNPTVLFGGGNGATPASTPITIPVTTALIGLNAVLLTANVQLQANNDISVNQSIAPGTGTHSLELDAGRSITFANNVTLTLGGAFTAKFDDTAATQTIRGTGQGSFTMGTGSAITAPGGITITDTTTGTVKSTSATAGVISLTTLSAAGGAILLTDVYSDANTTADLITATGALTTTSATAGTAGGALTLHSSGGISLGAITASGLGAGAGGNISLAADGGNIATGNVTTVGPGAGAGGTVTMGAAGTLGTGTITTSGAGAGAGGTVVLTGTGSMTLGTITTTSVGGAGGYVQLVLNPGTTATTLTLPAIAAGGATGSGGITAVNNSPVASSLVTTSGALDASGTGTNAIGGAVALQASGVVVNNPITANGTGTGAGGAVKLNGTVSLALDSTVSGGSLQTGVGAMTIGNGGAVTTSGGGQLYQGPVTLAQTAGGKITTLADTGTGNVTFASTVDSSATTTGQSLTVNSAGNEVFDGLVGGTTPLTTLTTDAAGTIGGTAMFAMNVTGLAAGKAGVTAGKVEINDGAAFNVVGAVAGTAATAVSSVLTTNAQLYHGAASLGTDTVLTDSGTGIGFGSTLDGTHNLTLNATGQEGFLGRVGGTSPLLGLTTNGGTTLFEQAAGSVALPSVTTVNVAVPGNPATGAQTYNSNVVLSNDTVLSSASLAPATGGGAITFNGKVDGNTSAVSLTALAGPGQTLFPAGATVAVAGLNLSGAQVTFKQPVGSGQPLNVLTVGRNGTLAGVTPSIAIDNGGFTTTAGQTFNDPVILGADSVFADTNTQNIDFKSTLNSDAVATPRALTVNTTGLTTFGGLVGATPLASVTTDTGGTTQIDGGEVVTMGAQTYHDAVTLGATTLLASSGNGNIQFSLTLDSDAVATARALTINSGGATIFGAAVGTTPLASLLTDVGGSTQINGGAITTTGAQTYHDQTTLGADTVLTSSGNGNIQFSLTLNSDAVATARVLTINTGGATIFGGVVGATPLASVLTDAAGTTQINGGAITTTGAQTYNDPVTLGINGATIAAPLTTTLTATGAANVTFNNTLDGNAAGTQALVVNSPADEAFGKPVGAIQPLASLATDNGGSPGGNTFLGNAGTNTPISITTTGLQSYSDPVLLFANTVLKAGSLALPATSIDGASSATAGYDLTLTIGSAITVSGGTATGVAANPSRPYGILNNLGNFVSNGAGAVTVNADFETFGSQTFTNQVYLVGGTRAFRSDDNLGISFAAVDSSVAGTYDGLAVNTGGATTFGGQVGGVNPLGSVTTDVGGTTVFGYTGAGNAVQTVNNGTNGNGAQTYNDAVAFAQNTTLESAAVAPGTVGGSISFTNTGTVDGPGALTLNTTGATGFAGVVGGGTPLGSLTVLAGGTGTTISANAITTVGAQTYGSPLLLGGDVTLSSTGTDANASAITFNSTVSGAFTLTTATAGGNTVFGATSASDPGALLTGLTTSANGSTVFDNAAFTTNGTQDYQGPVVVQSVTRALTLTAATGNLVFDQTLGSTAASSTDLTLTTTAAGSSVTFTGAVGGGTTAPSATALNSLTVTSPMINIDGGVVNTASTNPGGTANDGAQSYNGVVLLGASTTFVGATITSTGVIDAQNHDLTLTLSSLVTIPLAGFANVDNFTSNGTGGTNIAGNFATTGFQHYENFVTVGAPSILTAGPGTDSIRFDSTLNSPGAFALTLSTPGVITFAGLVGNADPLGSLTTTGGGTNDLNGGAVITVGDQSYSGPVVLGATAGQTTLTSNNTGTIGFGATIDGKVAGTQALITRTSGEVDYNGAVGGLDALKSLTADGTGTTKIDGGGVTTAEGGQDYNGPVSFNGGAATTTLKDTLGGNILFGSTVDNFIAGTPALTLTTAGNLTFTKAVGSAGALGSLTASAGGTIFVNGGSVASGGSQTYGNPNAALLGAVSLGKSATFTSATGAITFDATVDGTVAGAQGLIVNTPGNEVFNGLIGHAVSLASLTTDGGAGQTQFNMAIGTAAAGVNVTGDVTVNDAVLFAATGSTLAQPTVLTGGSQAYNGGGTATQNTALVGGGTLTSTGTLDFGGTNDLSLRFGGLVTLPGAFKGVRNFLTDGTGGTLLNGTFTTTGTQTYSDAVTLAGAPVLNSVGDLIFNNPVDGAAPLTLGATGAGAQVIFNANALVGNTTPIGTLTSASTGGTIFNVNAGAAAANKGGVNAAAVAITGPVTFDEAGSTLTTNAHPSILTSGPQVYSGPATLALDTSLVSTGSGGGGAIAFDSAAATIDSAAGTLHALNLNALGTQTFSGLIGSANALASLTTGPGATIFDMAIAVGATAGVLVDGPVTTTGPAIFNVAGSSLTQPSVLTLGGGAQTYGTLTNPPGTAVTLQGAVTVLNSATTETAPGRFTGGGTITFNGSIVSPGGTSELDVRAGVGTAVFDGPINTTGDFAPGGASVVFNGAVGPLGTFTVEPNDPGTGLGRVDLNGSSYVTGGSQLYQPATVLSINTILRAGGNVTFLSTLDGSNLFTNNPYTLTINVNGGLIAFDGVVGGLVPLASLTTGNVGAAMGTTQFNMILPLAGTGKGGVNVLGAVTIDTNADFEATGLAGGTVPTILSGVTYRGATGTGTQTYGQPGSGAAVTLGQDTILQDLAATGSITFNGNVNAKMNAGAGLSVNAVGDEKFNQLVGNRFALANLSTDALGIAGGSARFDMNLTQDGALAGVRVAGAVNINDRAVFDATGGLALPTILSGGAQNYVLAATVMQGTILTGTGPGDVTFLSTVDSGATAQALQVNTPGNEVFAGLVGSTSPLASLTTDATGTATGQAQFLMTLPLTGLAAGVGGVNTTGDVTIHDGVIFQVVNTAGLPASHPGVSSGGTQIYNGPATLGALTVLTSTGGSILFNGTLDSDATATPRDLTTNTPTAGSTTTFARAVGGAFPLASLTTNGLGTTQLDGGSIVTTGSQIYFQPVTLGQDTAIRTLDAGGNVDFHSSLDGTYNLTVAADAASFLAVGNTSPLVNLTVTAPSGVQFTYTPALVSPGNAGINLAGTLTLNGPAVFDAANDGNIVFVRTGVAVPGQSPASGQDYAGNFALSGNAIFTDLKSGGITFHAGVDGSSPSNPANLTVSTGGAISFLNPVGSVTPLTSLTTSNLGLASGSTLLTGGGVTTTGAQTYNDAVTLGANTVLASSAGGDIAFALTLDSNAAATPQTLVVDTAGRTIFAGAVGATNPLASLTTDNEGAQDAGTLLTGGGVTTTGAQTYNDAVTLGADTVLASSAAGSLVFNGTVNGAFALTLDTGGLTIFNRPVGGSAPLAALTTDNESVAGEATQFNMPVGDAAGVVVNGPVTINDAVFFNVQGASLTLPGILTLGNADQTYNGPVILGTSTFLVSALAIPATGGAFTGGGAISFNSPQGITSAGGGDLFVRAGVGTTRLDSTVNVDDFDLGGASVTVQGPINLTGTLSIEPNGNTGGGSIMFGGGSLTTVGAQTYHAAFVLGGNTLLTSTGGADITFLSTVDGAHALTLDTTGDEVFDGRVGGSTPLTSLTTDDPRFIHPGGNAIFNIAGSTSTLPGVTTTGAQIFNDAVTLQADTVLASIGGGISFARTVDSASAATPRNLTLNAAGDETFNGRVGGNVPLASLTTDDPAAKLSGGQVVFNIGGSTTALPGVTTTGAQTYYDAVLLQTDTVLASAGGGALTFHSTVDSVTAATPHSLVLNTSGNEVFDGQVGSHDALLSLTTDDPAANTTGGQAIFNVPGGTASVTTTGFQTYHDAVTLQDATNLTSTGGGALTFAAVNGAFTLTLNTAGSTTLNGVVGGSSPLASLTTGSGALALDGGAVTTTGLQTYGGAVSLGVDTTLASTSIGGGITFARTVDSASAATPRNLTLNAAGDETFNGRVGGNVPLASLTTDDPAAKLSGGQVVFNIGGSTTALPGVTTTGAQTYYDAAGLQKDTVLASTNGDALTFHSTVDSSGSNARALTLDTTGNEVFNGSVGGTDALLSLTTDDPAANETGGQVVFGPNGAGGVLSVTTTGFQTYHDAVLLQGDTTLTSTNGGALMFASTVDGTHALTLNSKGDEDFFGQVGRNGALTSLVTDGDANNAGGSVRFYFAGTNGQPSVLTSGAQTYHDAAILQADTVLTSSGGGRLAFGSTVDNSNVTDPHALTLNTSGDEVFNGLVGAAKAIGDLTTDATGPVGGQAMFNMNLAGQKGGVSGVNVIGAVRINDAVVFDTTASGASNVTVQATGAQSYGKTTLGTDTILGSSGHGAFTFASTIDGAHALTISTGGRTTFNGAIGSGDALASLTTQNGGAVTLDAGTVITSGAQGYSGAVTLGRDTSLTSSGSGITFGATVDGDHALTLSTAGATTFDHSVGATDPLATLTAADGSAVVLQGGNVSTHGLQTYGGTLTVNGPDAGTTILLASNEENNTDATQSGNVIFKQAVTVNGGSLLVEGRRILAEADANIAVANTGSLDLEASDVLILEGSSYGSDAGRVTLNDPADGVTPNSVNKATIFLTGPRTLFHGGSFDMGYLQNMYSLGSITINVGSGNATLSDIAANNALTVTAGTITLQARNPDGTRGGVGTGGTDDGLNFVARTSINFGNTPIHYNNAHSTNDVANFVTSTGLVTVNRNTSAGVSLFQDSNLGSTFSNTDAGLHFSDDDFADFAAPFQPISGGTQTIDTAAALSGALPDQKPIDIAVDLTVTASQMEELKKLGIHPRVAQRQERLSLNSKRALFAQLVDGQDKDNYGRLQPIKGGISRLVPSDYVVVVDRMGEREVRQILTAFEELYGKNKEKAAPIGEAFNTAFTDYTTEKQTADPAGFAPYIEAHPGKYPDVDKAVRGFDNLFGYIESLGLTDREQAKSKEHIASDLEVSGVSPEDMVKVIDALRTRIPKDQKASSTKLPPSPPASAPAPGATNPASPAKPTAPPLKTARRQPGNSTRKTAPRITPARENRLPEVAGL